MSLYEKYGEFDSADEINRAAAAQLEEGDTEAVLQIAKENGIDEMDAEDFCMGDLPTLCNHTTAALGKIEMETKSISKIMALEGYISVLKEMIADDGEEKNLCIAIRRKGKNLVDLLGKLVAEASKKRVNLDAQIVAAARKLDKNIPSTLPVSGMSIRDFKEIVLEYYDVAPVQQKKED